ncbi:hypothetical protein H5V04_21250 [Escherichia coli]|nr:hypothetical protein [Escherichia coli]
MRTEKQIRSWRDLQIAYFAHHPVSGSYTAPETPSGWCSRIGTHKARMEYRGTRDDGCPCRTVFTVESTRWNSKYSACNVSVAIEMSPDCGHEDTCRHRESCHRRETVSIKRDGTRVMRAIRDEIDAWSGSGTITKSKVL